MKMRSRPQAHEGGRATNRSNAHPAHAQDPDSEERPARSLAGAPAAWLEQLLAACSEAILEDGPAEAAARLLDRVFSLLPQGAVGMCLGPIGALREQHVIRRLPACRLSLPTRDPTRLFPEFLHEQVWQLARVDGCSLHFATDEPESLLADGPIPTLMNHLATASVGVLHASATHAETRALREEMARLHAQVIQTEKLASLGQIAAGVVHELNNPLTSIIGYTSYLRSKSERLGGDPLDIERLDKIAEAAERILRFSHDLMSYARPSILVPAALDIHDVIDQALGFCRHQMTRVEIVRRFSHDVQRVRGVRGQLTQVFVNLITNACHAMDERGGTLWLETSMSHPVGSVRIDLTDTGDGIPSEIQHRVFEPFFTTKTEGQGTGLGLSIVRKIVRMHGGDIAVRSAPGGGATFSVGLPVAE